jgi:hypothetical protein
MGSRRAAVSTFVSAARTAPQLGISQGVRMSYKHYYPMNNHHGKNNNSKSKSKNMSHSKSYSKSKSHSKSNNKY